MVLVLVWERIFLVHEVFHEPLENCHNCLEVARVARKVSGYVIVALNRVPLARNLSLDVTDMANGHHKRVVVVPDIVVSRVVNMAVLVERLET